MAAAAKALVGYLLAHVLVLGHELFDACTVDVNPGSPATVALLFHRPPVRHGVLPDNWWTWLVQYLVPSGGPAVTSYAPVVEGCLVLAVCAVAALLDLVVLISSQPVPGHLASPAFVGHRQGGIHEHVPGDDRGRGTHPGRLRPAHAL